MSSPIYYKRHGKLSKPPILPPHQKNKKIKFDERKIVKEIAEEMPDKNIETF